MIDIVIVEYGNGEELCWAPFNSVCIGDEVETQFGRGIVKERDCMMKDKVWEMMWECKAVSKVLAIIRRINYEGEEA